MEKSEIEAKIIKKYRLSFLDLLALHYNTFKYLFLAVLLFVPTITLLAVNSFDWHWALYLIPLEILLLYVIIRGLLFLRDLNKYKTWGNSMMYNPDHATIYSGPPGSGKSLSAGHAVNWMQKGSWDKLQFEYFCLMGKMQTKNYVMSEDDKEVYESYQYFIRNPGIPCLATNVGFYSKIYRRFSYKLGPSYLKQERRAPYRLVGWYDEIGTVFNPELSNDAADKMKSLEMADMARFSRQFAEFRYIGTEQEASNIYKNIRRVVARNREYLSIETIFKPKFLNWVFEKMKKHFLYPLFRKGMNVHKAKRWGQFMQRFKKFIDNVGFYKLRYKDFTSFEGAGVACLTDEKGGAVLYLPCCGEFKYDTRAFRWAYKVRKMPIMMQVFDSMDLSEKEAEAFLRSSYPKIKEEEKQKKKER